VNQDIRSPKKWYKNKKWWIAGGFLVLIIGGFLIFRGDKQPSYETVIVKRDVLIQEVSITGRVKPAQAVDLQFESSGRISTINYKVGEKVNAGATIASLENQDLQAAVVSARADLEKTKRNFDSLANSSVYSSLRVELENAEENLAQVKVKAEGDLAADYSSAFNAMREAMTQIDTSDVVLEYLRKTYLEAKDPWDSKIKQYQLVVDSKTARVESTFPQIDQAGTTVNASLYGQIDLVSREVVGAAQSLREAFTYLQGEVQNNTYLISSSTDRASVNTEATAISSDLSSVLTAIQNISDQKIANDKNISDAESNLASAKAAFPTHEDILQKEAALLSAQSQLRKSIIVAPFAGIIGKIDVERGQTVTSSTMIVSLISASNYQIEANITEVDIGKVGAGNPATLTLDAYGSQQAFSAVVSTVDTAATIVEGVTTYKTIFDFTSPVESGVRPNMTANIDIQTARKENTIAIPQRAVINRDGEKIVRIYHGPKVALEERVVSLGMSGKDGFVEIVSGLSEGEQVVTFVND
jgi:HlyD family secretion protein